MSRGQYEAIIRQYLRGWETGDRSLFEQVLAPDFVDYMYGHPRTREALLEQAEATTFTDRQITIEDVMCDGDSVAVRVTSRLTHAETGKQTTVTGMIMVRIKDGKMVEGWGEHDRLGQLQQLGAIPRGEEYRGWVREKLSLAT